MASFYVGPFLIVLWLFCEVATLENPLDGKQLRCCALEQFPSLYKNAARKPYNLDGLAINYLTELQTALNFRCKSIDVIPKSTYGFSRFVEIMAECQKDKNATEAICYCDLATGAWILNAVRYKLVDFLPPFIQDDFITTVHIDYTTKSSNAIFFISVFTGDVWLAMAGLLLFFTFIKVFDRRFAIPDHSFTPLPDTEPIYLRIRHVLLKGKFLYRIRKAAMSTLGSMIGQETVNIPGDGRGSCTTRQWTLNFIILLCGILFMFMYESAMTTQILQQKTQSSFHDIEDFKSCKIDPRYVCVPSEGAVETFWKTSISTGECHKDKDKKAQFENSYDLVIDNLAQKKCKFLFTDGLSASDAVYGSNCGKIVRTGLPQYSAGQSFILPKGSNYTEALTKATLKLQDQRRLQTPDQYLEQRGKCHITSHESISLSSLRIFFIISYGVCFVLLLEMTMDPQEHVQQQTANETVQESGEGDIDDMEEVVQPGLEYA